MRRNTASKLRIQSVTSFAFMAFLVGTLAILAGCGESKPAPEVPPVGRYQIVSGQYAYWRPNDTPGTTSATFKIDTATGKTFQFVPESNSLGGSWVEVK
jgi:hypothetical protein